MLAARLTHSFGSVIIHSLGLHEFPPRSRLNDASARQIKGLSVESQGRERFFGHESY